ncbi:MAG: 50S ribosomal protein L28 [Holosporaceae bacterium]|jgi:large subunit ribosomal protein L28|nr:50S ribosomal protein L28 [Holosporaceae bacterium]
MSRVCSLSGKAGVRGNRVSHANNKTKRRFLPNLQVVSFASDVLGMCVRVRASTAAVRSVEKNGGIDKYLLKTSKNLLTAKFRKIKKILESRK